MKKIFVVILSMLSLVMLSTTAEAKNECYKHPVKTKHVKHRTMAKASVEPMVIYETTLTPVAEPVVMATAYDPMDYAQKCGIGKIIGESIGSSAYCIILHENFNR